MLITRNTITNFISPVQGQIWNQEYDCYYCFHHWFILISTVWEIRKDVLELKFDPSAWGEHNRPLTEANWKKQNQFLIYFSNFCSIIKNHRVKIRGEFLTTILMFLRARFSFPIFFTALRPSRNLGVREELINSNSQLPTFFVISTNGRETSLF